MKIVTLDSVEHFIQTLQSDTSASVARAVKRLETYGVEISMPHSKQIDRGLFELRVLGRQSVRIFYVYRNNSIYLLHGFIKKQNKIPLQELEIARRYRDLLHKYNL